MTKQDDLRKYDVGQLPLLTAGDLGLDADPEPEPGTVDWHDWHFSKPENWFTSSWQDFVKQHLQEYMGDHFGGPPSDLVCGDTLHDAPDFVRECSLETFDRDLAELVKWTQDVKAWRALYAWTFKADDAGVADMMTRVPDLRELVYIILLGLAVHADFEEPYSDIDTRPDLWVPEGFNPRDVDQVKANLSLLAERFGHRPADQWSGVDCFSPAEDKARWTETMTWILQRGISKDTADPKWSGIEYAGVVASWPPVQTPRARAAKVAADALARQAAAEKKAQTEQGDKGND